ncbi:MAG: 5-formyltetrahydrofolate cyclo-ligase [Actinomycetota bacterium]|nr:5-formyltetrahydrofolate cyclo-ligase [Actinomycetota bacterium]
MLARVTSKAAVRDSVLARRQGLSGPDRTAAGAAFARALAEAVASARRVAGYTAFATEPPTTWLAELRQDLLLPVLLGDGDLDWCVNGGSPLGPDAIATCDLVVVPALAVDRSGNRLGRGGGSYDRALARATGRTIALLYDGELLDELPVEPHDRRVDAVVTPALGLVTL